jgi:predicted transcriptional regulator
MSNRAQDLDTIRVLLERLRAVQAGATPRFLIVFDTGGVQIREIVEIATTKDGPVMGWSYRTYPVATGSDLPEAVKNARVVRWSPFRQ